MPQYIPVTCNGCGKRLLIEHAISCPKVVLDLARNNGAEKELGDIGAWDLFPSAITYKPKINSRKVQGGGTEAGARQEGGTAKGGADIEL